MLVISSNFVFNFVSLEEDIAADLPLVGWHNLVTASGILADTEEPNYPASNLANPATHLEWRATDQSEQYLTVSISASVEIDYLAVARHNFGSASIAISVEGLISGVWTELAAAVILPGDQPVIIRFDPQLMSEIRLRMQSGSEPARAAVVYVGKLLVMERKVYVGHTPIPHARKSSVVNGRSESGNFLGRIVLGSWNETTVPLSLLTPAWYRTYMDPFLAAAKDTPFFFAWRPDSYPLETGFAWLIDDPMPAPVGPSNRIALDLHIGALV